MAQIDTVAAVRRFNRFYTRAIGVLERSYMGGPYTLAENRVLYEIAHGAGVTPSAIAQALDLDAGYLSRMLGRLERDGLVARARSPSDGRSVTLSLTPQGAAFFASLNARTVERVEAMIGGLSSPQKAELAGALDTAQALLAPQAAKPPIVLRPHAVGDMGWVTERHGVFYGQAYGWAPKIEAVTARICADFLDNFDPDWERCWIAERGGERVGSVFMVREGEGVARLRLLLLEPAARGEGLGRRLVDECIAFAREKGYREIVLWTHEVLTAARAIYAAAGFKLVDSYVHDDFGKPEVSETWKLVL
ncbi:MULTISPECIES: bifunctional helix-turn-helix transcriptional regulator/GNAT family N-acetyltransferase [unclassified Phenylobacterium]|uniref:bifunctional helix-turn-helix transcriptional regulator/GNAT family N-acetyltransferase n=1 Tax=unclassified Phenylobacterium TaxID=2640670 RepID=UPI00083B243A|nr:MULTISPECIES: bifunctional helix-turn-helix transcriptional regulator/GNAT family N-acetyltransferase [unclassified Phenylobacterium]